MGVKDKVLKYLEENRGRTVSGTEMAELLSVSRNAVWKAVRSLQDGGYAITGVPNRGYTMDASNDILSRQSIEPFLWGGAKDLRIQVHKLVSSTNTLGKELAMNGEPEGAVIVAEEQNGGKGRMGRSFYSPKGTGVYFSLLLRPEQNAEDALFLTTTAAVAVARAIEKVTSEHASIKWVNDVYCHGKKVCGILTEAGMDFESRRLDYAVVGIGINVTQPEHGFPQELTNKAAALCDSKPERAETRSRLIAETLSEFWDCYRNGNGSSCMEEYRKRSFLIGHTVEIVGREDAGQALVLDVDEKARLRVRFRDGTEKALSSGEVSIVMKPEDNVPADGMSGGMEKKRGDRTNGK